jgi:hypothetical protein
VYVIFIRFYKNDESESSTQAPGSIDYEDYDGKVPDEKSNSGDQIEELPQEQVKNA